MRPGCGERWGGPAAKSAACCLVGAGHRAQRFQRVHLARGLRRLAGRSPFTFAFATTSTGRNRPPDPAACSGLQRPQLRQVAPDTPTCAAGRQQGARSARNRSSGKPVGRPRPNDGICSSVRRRIAHRRILPETPEAPAELEWRSRFVGFWAYFFRHVLLRAAMFSARADPGQHCSSSACSQ